MTSWDQTMVDVNNLDIYNSPLNKMFRDLFKCLRQGGDWNEADSFNYDLDNESL